MSEQEVSDAQRADLYLSRATRLQAVVDDLRRESTRNLETAELAVEKGVDLQQKLEAVEEWLDVYRLAMGYKQFHDLADVLRGESPAILKESE